MTSTIAIGTITGLPFGARGPLSDAAIRRLVGRRVSEDLTALAREAVRRSTDVIRDDDVQLALFVLYASAYGSLPAMVADVEWDTDVIEARRVLEGAFEEALRVALTPPSEPRPRAEDVAEALFDLTAPSPGPSLARWIAKKAEAHHVREMLIHRSVYTLREADPHSWAIPRLTGRPKAALVEIQADEYGGGRPERIHAVLYANAMRAAGLKDAYGAYVDQVPAVVLANHNVMSMFGLNRRLLGAIVGHLAAFEMTSSIPSRMYADGLRRLGMDEDVIAYFDEHVEADAVHEQIAGRDLAGALAEDRPELVEDIMFGAAACIALDEWTAAHVMQAWEAGVSSLREPSSTAEVHQ